MNLWGTKLVTLSACDTGVGEVRNGEGVYGLRRAFVLAGAETIVMSLWPVSDYLTREMMTAYYTGLRAGLGRGDALRHAKLAMLAQLEAYRDKFEWAYVVSCNLYGPRDKFDIINGHVVPSLIRKFYEAKRDGTDVTVWGDGSAKRDFIYIKDAARFISLVMDQVQGPINMGAKVIVKIFKCPTASVPKAKV